MVHTTSPFYESTACIEYKETSDVCKEDGINESASFSSPPFWTPSQKTGTSWDRPLFQFFGQSVRMLTVNESLWDRVIWLSNSVSPTKRKINGRVYMSTRLNLVYMHLLQNVFLHLESTHYNFLFSMWSRFLKNNLVLPFTWLFPCTEWDKHSDHHFLPTSRRTLDGIRTLGTLLEAAQTPHVKNYRWICFTR